MSRADMDETPPAASRSSEHDTPAPSERSTPDPSEGYRMHVQAWQLQQLLPSRALSR